MVEIFNEQLNRLKKIFTEEYKDGNGGKDGIDILLAYIFGSQLKGKTGPLSDYDFAILLSRKPPFQYKYKLQNKLTNLFNFIPVDLVILNNAPIELKYHIVADGKIIYQKELSVKVEFEADTLSRYFDYLPILQAQKEDLLDFNPKGVKHVRRVQRYRTALRKTEKKLAKIRTFYGKE